MTTLKFPEIRTERLLMRRFVDSDINNVFRGLSHPEVIKYYGVSFRTLELTREQMSFFSDLEKNGTGIWWAICSPDNETFYGAGGLNDLKREDRKAEVGFWLMPDFWGKGIMAEAMPLICSYGFENLGLHRIEAFVDSENVNCKKAMSKLTFQYEGTMRECEIKDDRFISLDLYAILNN